MLPPKCPQHPKSTVYLDGPLPQWSEFYEKRLWRCHPIGKANGNPSHRFIPGGELMRHPTHRLPDFHGECPHCESAYAPDEGPKIGRGFTLVAEEAAATLNFIGMGESYRSAAMLTRQKAKRYQFDPSQNRWKTDPVTKRKTLLTTGAARDRVENRYSRQCNLSAYYLDVFGPAVVKKFARKAWPRVIVLDSQPLKVRSFDPERRKGRPGGADAGEILAVVDRTTRPGRVMTMWMAGGKNGSEWKRLFNRPDFDPSSAPQWIVSDDDGGIDKAVAEVWPYAIHFKCEAHLTRNAVDKAALDGIPEWVAKPGTPGGALVPRPEESKRDREAVWPASQPKHLFERHPVFIAMGAMFRTLADWDAFKAAVEQHVPPDKKTLRDWIADREALVLKQFDLKAQHPGMPVTNGAVEGVLIWARGKFAGRAGRLKNIRRVQVALDLMVLFRSGQADEQLYARAIRAHMRGQANRGSGVTRLDWPAKFWDPKGTSSMDEVIRRSDVDRARERYQAALDAGARRMAELVEAEEETRATAGDPVGRGRKLRPPDKPPRGVRPSRRGKRVSDFPAAAEWDHEANGDRTPSNTRATSLKTAAWVCRAHLGDIEPHKHHWTASPESRTGSSSGCPFCMNRKVCQANCLARVHPRTVEEWSPEGNGDKTPCNIFPGTNFDALWLCLRSDGQHPPYRQRVSSHVLDFKSCPLHKPDHSKDRERGEATRVRQRRNATTRTGSLNGELWPADLTADQVESLPQLVWPVDTVLDFGADPDDEDF